MKVAIQLIFFPIFALAGTLSQKEIDKLVEHAFYSKSGYNSKNFSRWNKPIHLFVNPMWDGNSTDRTHPTRRELDEIKKVTDDITQLTGIQYIIHEDPLTLEEVRSYVMNNPKVGSVQMYFVPRGIQSGGTSARNSARITINTHFRKSNGQDFEYVLHNIREELTHAIGLPGDTYSGIDKFSALEGNASHFGREFSLMDRRNIYAYYALDKESGHEYPPSYTEAEFRQRIAEVEIDGEIVNGGRFEGMVDPEFTDFEMILGDGNQSKSKPKPVESPTEIQRFFQRHFGKTKKKAKDAEVKYLAEISFETIHKTGPSKNRFDIVFFNDLYFDGETNAYVKQVSLVWAKLKKELHFWNRYQNFFNVHRIDLPTVPRSSVNRLRDFSSPFGINYKNGKWGPDWRFYPRWNYKLTNRVIGELLEHLELEGDTKIVVIGHLFTNGVAHTLTDICYLTGSDKEGGMHRLLAHELGHSQVGLKDEYIPRDMLSTYRVPNMAFTLEEAREKWGHWYGYNGNGIQIGKLENGSWAPFKGNGNYYQPALPTLMAMGWRMSALEREEFVIDLYNNMRPIDSHSDNTLPVTVGDILEVNVVDREIVDVSWLVDGKHLSGNHYFVLDEMNLDENATISLVAWDNTLNTDYQTDDRGGWVRKDDEGKLVQKVDFKYTKVRDEGSWQRSVPTFCNKWKKSNWLGHFFVSENDWIYHEKLGWIYPVKSNGGIWFFKSKVGWFWTSPKAYPWLHADDYDDWMYLKSTDSGHLFYHFSKKKWIAEN